MANYSPFDFTDSLTSNGKKNLHDELLIGDKTPEVVLILRLLSGSAILTHNYSGTVCKCRRNYFATDFKNYGQNWRKKFPKLISEDVTADDIGDYINSAKYINKEFYKNILSEISYYIYSTRKRDHSSSFIYIYRLLEKISYAFPLIYASRTQDFLQSFTQLKDLMIGSTEKKELGFFKKFVESLYKDDAIADTSIDIQISASNETVQKQLFSEMRNVLNDKIIHGDTNEPNQLSIKYNDMGSFIITIRNRFFHNMNGSEQNIKTQNIADADVFFEAINDLAMQWLATIFLGVLTHSIDEFQKSQQAIAH